MTRKITTIILLLMSLCVLASAHDHKAAIIIDTDCAPDDLRAITLFLADSHVQVIAITVTDGACSAEVGFQKVKALLKELGKEKIAVAIGRSSDGNIPAWREFAESIPWGLSGENFPAVRISARELIVKKVNDNKDVALIMLGSLANLDSALALNPGLKGKVAGVYWFNNGPLLADGTNYQQAPEAAETVIKSGLPIKVFSNSSSDGARFNLDLYEHVKAIFNPYARVIRESHSGAEAMSRIQSSHFGIWDELIPIWFSRPEIFSFAASDKWDNVYLASLPDTVEISETFLDILARAGGRQASVVLEQFPLEAESYRKDLRKYVEQIITRHGKEEWRYVVLTSELHRHLGIYSIVGAKMGLRAREILGADLDDVTITSQAGLKPPISCLNDGLQISTGATLGQGKIQVRTDSPKVEAEFYYDGHKLTLTLKKEIIQQVKRDIRKGIEAHGLHSPLYWKYVRELALEYWLHLERSEIFTGNLEDFPRH